MKGFEGKEDEESEMKEKPEARTSRKAPKSPGKMYTWRDLIPVVKVDVFSVCVSMDFLIQCWESENKTLIF
jgi:hypothetical protein